MPSENLNEQEIQFKKRARRRLVGAVALVLLMVTILPMILDDKAAKAPQQDIAITIPSQDGSEFDSKIVPVAPDQSTSESEIADPEAAESTITPTSPPTAATPAPLRADAEPVEPEPPAASEKLSVKKEAPSPAASEDKKKTVGSGFVVQIGVFSEPDNVKQMQQKLTSLGIKSGTQKVSTTKGEKIRLRTTSFATRAEAEAALAKVQGAGLSGMVISNK